MRYRVYVWKSRQDVPATVVEEIRASSAAAAVQAVLYHASLAFAFYVWVVSPDDDELTYSQYRVHALHPGGAYGKS